RVLLDVVAVDAGEAEAVAPEGLSERRKFRVDGMARLAAGRVLAGKDRDRMGGERDQDRGDGGGGECAHLPRCSRAHAMRVRRKNPESFPANDLGRMRKRCAATPSWSHLGT